MKEILQTKVFKVLSLKCLCFCSLHVLHFYHVENVARVYPMIEVEETEEEIQEEQLQEFEVANEDQVLETDFANPDSQQGKHRSILTLCRTKVKFYTFNLCI